jgi:hypothetical protein
MTSTSYKLHIWAYHKPSSGQEFNSFNQLHNNMCANYGIPYGLQLLKYNLMLIDSTYVLEGSIVMVKY